MTARRAARGGGEDRAPRERLQIESVAPGGAGVARRGGGQVVFVPGVLPGEVVEVVVLRDRGRQAFARLEAVVESSPHRVGPRCPVYGICGGCQLQHARYDYQLELKQEMVAETLRRIGKVPHPAVLPVLPSPSPWGYRNRAAVHSNGRDVGFHAAGSRRVVDVEHCAIASDEVNRQLAALRASRRPWSGTRVLREPAPFRGFRQVNEAAAQLLLEEVLRRLQPGGDFLVEGYCGGGFFTAPAAALFRRVAAVEWSRASARAARESLPPNVRVHEGDAEALLPELVAQWPVDAVLVDPPAAGLGPGVIEALLRHPPPRVVYVSCDPATFARDIARLRERFEPGEVRPVDMFPQTAHVECVGVLERVRPSP